MNLKECCGVVAVSIYFYSSRHIYQIRQSIEILKCLGISKIFVVQDVKTKIAFETFSEKNVEVVPADVFETCQKWYIGLKKAFQEGYSRCFVFPCDITKYEGKDVLANPTNIKPLIKKLERMLSDTSELVIGDYSVPHGHLNPKYHLSKNGAISFLNEFFPEEYEIINDLDILYPRSEYFIVSYTLFNSFLDEKFSKWMAWEATIQLIIYAIRRRRTISRHYLGEIGDTDTQRDNIHELASQYLRIHYTVINEYLKYHGYQGDSNHMPEGWLLHLKRSQELLFNNLKRNFIVTIDGPTAAGKSTVSAIIAKKFDFLYLDGGIFFRALTLKAINKHIDLENEQKLCSLLQRTKIEFKKKQKLNSMEYSVILDDEDVTNEIRTPLISSKVPSISKHMQIREQRKIWLRNLGESYNIIAEGRTLGKEIFPDANIKFYLDASIEKRTLRRKLQNEENGKIQKEYEVRNSIIEREKEDSKGEINRVKRDRNSFYLDTSSLQTDEVVNILLQNILPHFEAWKEMKENSK